MHFKIYGEIPLSRNLSGTQSKQSQATNGTYNNRKNKD